MHATLEQLLAIRDRLPVAARVQQHADTCLSCSERLQRMTRARDDLIGLPVLAPARDYWPVIQARMEHARPDTPRRVRLARYAGLGLAASLIFAASLFIRQPEDASVPVSPGAGVIAQQVTEPAADTGADHADWQPAREQSAAEADLDTLIARSAYLEAVLHAMPRRPRVARASTTDLIAGLQDGVALVDYQLNQTGMHTPPQASRQLWQQRIDLMNSLVNVRYAEVQRVAYSPN